MNRCLKSKEQDDVGIEEPRRGRLDGGRNVRSDLDMTRSTTEGHEPVNVIETNEFLLGLQMK